MNGPLTMKAIAALLLLSLAACLSPRAPSTVRIVVFNDTGRDVQASILADDSCGYAGWVPAVPAEPNLSLTLTCALVPGRHTIRVRAGERDYSQTLEIVGTATVAVRIAPAKVSIVLMQGSVGFL